MFFHKVCYSETFKYRLAKQQQQAKAVRKEPKGSCPLQNIINFFTSCLRKRCFFSHHHKTILFICHISFTVP